MLILYFRIYVHITEDYFSLENPCFCFDTEFLVEPFLPNQSLRPVA